MDDLLEAGLGLDYNTLRLDRTTKAWVTAGERLRERVADELDGLVAEVQQIGSASVEGLLAKPIADLAAGLRTEDDLAPAQSALERSGWIYRGDAGDAGGHVFVLEARPWHRVAHLHLVKHQGRQWQNYLLLRDLLRRSPQARASYEAVKQKLSTHVGDDRDTYTQGKTAIVRHLLGTAGGTAGPRSPVAREPS